MRPTWISVNHLHHCYIFTWVVVDLFQPWLQVYVCITYFINYEDEIFTGLLPFALDQLQDFAHLKKKRKRKKIMKEIQIYI